MAAERRASFVSPARCAERPWDLWVAELGRGEPRRDPDPPKARRRPGLHRLRREAMPTHGLLPARDGLRAALCGLCGAVLRCSAAARHLAAAHAGLPPPPPPPARRRRRRDRPGSPVHTACAPLSRRAAPARDLFLEEAGPVQVCLRSGELPVVSIQDPEELPLGENLTDDIFAIMNSEGIQSADDIASATDWKNIIRDIGNLQDIGFPQPEPPGREPFPSHATSYALPEELSLRFAGATPPPAEAPHTPQALKPPPTPSTPRSQRSKTSKTKFNLREYDANKHCGVTTAEGKPCTRSLTCKAHALSLRRMVEGRAKPFDTLLAEHRASREASAAAASAPPPPPPVDLPPLLVNNSIDLSAFNGLTTEQQVNDIYSLLSVDDTNSLLADPSAITSLLNQPLSDAFVMPEEVPQVQPSPVERIAPERVERIERHERIDRHDTERRERERTSSRTREETPGVVAGDVCWYTSCPRPLALCTYNAAHAGGAITLGKKFATVRSNIKSSLSRSQCKTTGATNNFYYGQSALSLSKSVHMNSKTNKPEVRRLIVCSGSGKDVQTMGELFGGSVRPMNGHVGHSGLGKPRAPLKHSKHSGAPVLDLGFSLDPLLADEKC